MIPGFPVLIAANRDEFLERPAEPPMVLAEHPRVVGGKDLRAGGTWLGINEHGVVAGLLNRHTDAANPSARSRGLLCLDALRCASAADAAEMARGERGGDYNPFNLLIASPAATFVAYDRDGRIEVSALTPGLHLLTNLDADDFECPRISRAFEKFARLTRDEGFIHDPVGRRDELIRLLADHSTQLDPRTNRPNSLCLHLGAYGTRSASLIFMRADGRCDHFFAAGPPCTAKFARAALPREMRSPR